MSDPASSPDVSHEDHYEEQIDIGDDDQEDITDEFEGEGEGEPDEEEKLEGQEGLDLEMAEEDNIAFPDEPDGEHEAHIENGGSERHSDIVDERRADKVGEEVVVEEETEPEKRENLEEKAVDNVESLLSQPPHGSEVFVGGISKDTVEDDLRELCSKCGDIHEVRILVGKDTGENKGYAFVMFTNKENAERAIEMLNDSELKGKKLRFSQSQARHKLFIGNIPKNWDKEELLKILEDKGPGIESIELLSEPQDPARNRGFAFVDYYNHACAENAKKNMTTQIFKLGSNAPTVSWAEARGSMDSSALSQVKAVYVRNLPDGVTQEQLQRLFEHHGEVTKVVLPALKPGQSRFGFVHFTERSSALKAVEKTEIYELEDRVLEASLAKPPSERKPSDHQRASIFPPYQSRLGYGYSAAGLYGGLGPGYGSRGYNQPVIYGRGPAPADMTMVPMMLPDGRVGYVLRQESGAQGGSVPYRTGRAGHGGASGRQSGSGGASSGSSRRYRPY